jgi:GH25 family lysozyme M1 (1,4-beta-N-acetylmuramidase)
VGSTAVVAMAVVALVGFGVTSGDGGSKQGTAGSVLDASNGANPSEGHSPQLTQQLSGPLSGTGLKSVKRVSNAAMKNAEASTTGASTILNGVDVSSDQGTSINWADVAAGGYNFASIKSTEGNYYVDPDYAADAKAAVAAGMYIAPYHFANPPKSTGAAQAEYAYTNTGDYKVGGQYLPMVLDIEYDPYASANHTNECYGLSASAMVSWISSFVNEATTLTGAAPIIYTTQDWWATCTDDSAKFTSDPLWVAAYSSGDPGTLPYGWSTWAMWQYTSDGTVNGISGDVDEDYFSGWPQTETSLANVATSTQLQTLSSLADQSVSYTATGLPDGLTMSSAGLISGTPTTTGSYTVTITPSASSTVVPASISFTWTVAAGIDVTQPPLQITTAGSAVKLQLSDTDSDGGTPSFSATGLPTGLTVSSAGLISGWASTPGTYTVTVTAADSQSLSGSTSFSWTVNQAGDSGPTGRIVLDNGGKCIDDTGASTADGTRIQIWTCNGKKQQNWTLVQDETLRVLGMCLDDKNGGTANGNPVQLYTCGAGNVNQRWIVETDGELVNVKSGKCLDDSGYNTANGTKLQIWSCTGATNQRWTPPAVPFASGVPGLCLNDKSTANGGEIEALTCDGASAQAVTVKADATLRVAGKCLDVTGNASAAGAHVQLWPCLSNNTGEQWRIVGNGAVINPHSGKCLTDTGSGGWLDITACPSTPALGTSWHVF